MSDIRTPTRSLRQVVLLISVIITLAASRGPATRAARAPEGRSVDGSEQAAQMVDGGPPYALVLPVVVSRHEIVPAHHLGAQVYGAMDDAAISHGALRHSRAYWMRWELSWAGVEPTEQDPPAYNWSGADGAILAAHRQGIHLIVTILSNPAWAALHEGDYVYTQGPYREDPAGDPDRYYERFAAFVAAFAERYDGDGMDDAPGSPVVTHVEMYNEPDRAEPWGGAPFWGDYGDLYAKMLGYVYPAVKQANPHATVVLGGLAYDHFRSDDGTGEGQFNREFLDDVLDAGGGAHFDVANFHFYPLFGPSWEAQAPGTDIVAKANAFRAVVEGHGLQKPVICTEIGVPSVSDEGICRSCSARVQARYVAQTAVRGRVARLGTVIWWTWKDLSPEYGGATALDKHGLIGADLQPKQALDTFRAATLKLQRATFAQTVRDDDAEVYRFVRADGAPLYALWARWDLQADLGSEPTPVVVTLPLATASVTDMYGTVIGTPADGDDGALDGRIRVIATADPVYVH